MNRHDLRRHVERARADLAGVFDDLDPLLSALDEYADDGLSSRPFDNVRVRGGSGSDRTAQYALGRRDEAAAARRRLEQLVLRAAAYAGEVRELQLAVIDRADVAR